MQIKTSHWFAKLPDDHKRIGISRGTPRGQAAGYRTYKRLAPGPWFNSVGPEEYDDLYRREILASLDPRMVAADLADMAPGCIPVLLCFERPNGKDWCHRAMVADWLSSALGHPVPEFGFEALPQEQHPLMPQELRRASPPAAAPAVDVGGYVGRHAMIDGTFHTVIGPDPDDLTKVILATDEGRFSTSLANLARYFG